MKLKAILFAIVLAVPSLSYSNDSFTDDSIAVAKEFEQNNLNEDSLSEIMPLAYYSHYICQEHINVRGPLNGAGYVGNVIGTADYGESVAIQPQRYTAWVNGALNAFVRVKFHRDGAYGYVARQYLCRY